MAIPLMLQAIGAGLLGQFGVDKLRGYQDSQARNNLLGSYGTPDVSRMVPDVNMSGQNFDPTGQPMQAMETIAGTPGTGLLGALDPNTAAQLEPLLRAMPMRDVRAYANSLLAPPKEQSPLSGIAKLQADLQSGRISPEQYQIGVEAMQKAGVTINNSPPWNLPTGMMLADPGDPSKGVQPIPGSEKDPASPNYKWTEGQSLAGGFASRMVEAEKTLGQITQQGFDPGSTMENLRAGIPLVGNYTASKEFQQYRQAQEDWVRAKLRKESGAVIGEEEMAAEIRTYFPQPGDSPEVIKQKERARLTATNAMVEGSGGFFERKLKDKQPEQIDVEAIKRKYGLD